MSINKNRLGGKKMPRGDATGPLGQGSMTGRGLGTCNPNVVSNLKRGIGYGAGIGAGIGIGLGLGRRRGCGQGLRRNINNNSSILRNNQSKEERKVYLENQLTRIQNELDLMD